VTKKILPQAFNFLPSFLSPINCCCCTAFPPGGSCHSNSWGSSESTT